MKNIYKGLLLAICVVIASGCNKELNVEPVNSADASLALNTPEDVQALLVGCYTAAGQLGLYGGRYMSTTDLLGYSGDISFFGTYQEYSEMNNKRITVNNVFAERVWNNGFETINSCNKVLESLSLVRDVNKDRTEGEAKFLRGMIYFDLARVFGRAWNDGDPNTNPAVPVVLTSTGNNIPADQDIQRKRESVARVFSQAISDLSDAKSKLPASNDFYANRYAAAAILSRIYLTQERFAEAEAEASFVLANTSYRLVSDLANDEFNAFISSAAHRDNTSEDVFAIQVTNQSGSNGQNEIFASPDFGGRGDVVINDAHYSLYEEGDVRKDLFYDEYTAKFNNLYGNNKLVRLSEMYLNRAEARIRKPSADIAGASNDINAVRERAGLSPVQVSSGNELLAALKHERLVELAFEGFRLFDAKRYKENVGGLAFNSARLIFPVPFREIQANPQLTQNEGY